MTFEERIDRLTERHEALALTVQQIEETQQRQQKMADALLQAIRDEHVARREADLELREADERAREANERAWEANERAWEETRKANQEQRERIDALVNAMESAFHRANQHEARINKLEGNS